MLAVCAVVRSQPVPATRVLPADTEIHLRLLEPVASNTHTHGDRFKLEVAEPVIVDGAVVIPAGAACVGEVVHGAMRILSTDSRTRMLACAAVLALTLAGCATTETVKPVEPAKSAQPAKSPAPAAAPAAAAPDAGIAAPTGDFANVVFFRESKFVGSMVSFKVREGEQELNKLSSGTCFVAQVPAGVHAYTVHSEAKDVLNLE